MILISKTLITDNTTIAGINDKEQYECEWVLMTLTNYVICTSILKFLWTFGQMMAYSGQMSS